MTALYLVIASALVAAFSIWYASIQRKRRKTAEGVLEAYQAGEKLRQELAKKTEVIRDEQAKTHAKVDTGDPSADFDASLNVLRDASARRRKT